MGVLLTLDLGSKCLTCIFMGDLLATVGNPAERRGFDTQQSTNFTSSPFLREL